MVTKNASHCPNKIAVGEGRSHDVDHLNQGQQQEDLPVLYETQ